MVIRWSIKKRLHVNVAHSYMDRMGTQKADRYETYLLKQKMSYVSGLNRIGLIK